MSLLAKKRPGIYDIYGKYPSPDRITIISRICAGCRNRYTRMLPAARTVEDTVRKGTAFGIVTLKESIVQERKGNNPKIRHDRRDSMKISTKGRYALRMMLDLAVHDTGEYISLKDISERQDITVKYLEQIVTALTRSGYLRSQRGNNGGYRLSKRPEDYTVGDILRVMEGPLEPVPCLEGDCNPCARSADCAVLPFWKEFSKVINDYADSVTLQDLKDQADALAGNDFVI